MGWYQTQLVEKILYFIAEGYIQALYIQSNNMFLNGVRCVTSCFTHSIIDSRHDSMPNTVGVSFMLGAPPLCVRQQLTVDPVAKSDQRTLEKQCIMNNSLKPTKHRNFKCQSKIIHEFIPLLVCKSVT